MSSKFTAFLERVWKILISLKFAVVVIVLLAIALALATILESKYDTRTAQYVVYSSAWFYFLLSMFGLLILAVAISRIPWKKKHIPFLMAHAGILMILIGSAVTAVNGVDGNLRITEGEVNSSVELDSQVLVFKRGDAVESADFPWMPEFRARDFAPQAFPKYGVEVTKYISDSEMKLDFRPVPAASPAVKTAPAVQIKIVGAPMGGAPEIWLWAGDPGWASQKLGLARFLVRREDQADLAPSGAEGPEARMDFVVMKNGELRFDAVSPRGEKRSGKIVLPVNRAGVFVSEEPVIVDPGWRMPIKIIVRKFVPNAANQVEYVPTKVKQQGGPVPALQIHLIGEGDNPKARMWLGLGDRADLVTSKGEEISVGFFPKRLVLPFALRLQRFEMKHNPGTMDPSAYSSHVQVVDQIKGDGANLDALPAQEISMNEPLKHGGYTFYQASFIPDFPRAVTTVLSVNYDPGRALKYTGSLLLVLGSIFLYLMKLAQSRRKAQA
jgi:hypothetical protein